MADLEGIIAGEYGKTVVLTCQDKSGVAQDISGYDGDKEMVFRAPKNLQTFVSTCDFNGTGTDGKLKFDFDSDDFPAIAGEWECQAELNDAGVAARAKTYVFTMKVEKALR